LGEIFWSLVLSTYGDFRKKKLPLKNRQDAKIFSPLKKKKKKKKNPLSFSHGRRQRRSSTIITIVQEPAPHGTCVFFVPK
jgi:hypothetical protein